MSLNLHTTEFADKDVDNLIEALSTRDQFEPAAAALRELRILSSSLTSKGDERIHSMLLANKNLRIVELVDPKESPGSEELFRRSEECHQDRLLRIHMAPRDALAFLSVLSGESAVRTRRESAKASLDSNLAATIFRFRGNGCVSTDPVAPPVPAHQRLLRRG